MTKPDRKARWAVASNRTTDRVLRGLWAVEGGIWLGLMDADDRAAATRLFYEHSEHWASDDLTRQGLATWESAVIETWFPRSGAVLIAAAGSGREALSLASMGYRVEGFDPSEALISRGTRTLAGTPAEGTLVLAKPNTVPDGLGGPFDAAIVGWGGISHMQGRDTRSAFLSAIREHLPAGAPLLVSFLHRTEGAPVHRITLSVANAIRSLRRSRAPIELGDTVHGSFDHFFTFSEMTNELAAAGFVHRFGSEQPYAHIVAIAE